MAGEVLKFSSSKYSKLTLEFFMIPENFQIQYSQISLSQNLKLRLQYISSPWLKNFWFSYPRCSKLTHHVQIYWTCVYTNSKYILQIEEQNPRLFSGFPGFPEILGTMGIYGCKSNIPLSIIQYKNGDLCTSIIDVP